MNLMEYVKPELLVLVPVLYLIGIGLRKSQLSNRWIPLLLGLAGIVIAFLYVLSTGIGGTLRDWAGAVFVAVTQGVICAGLSVYANQLFKQFNKPEE